MKKNKTIILVLFFFMGLLIWLYPSLSDFYNQKIQSKEIGNYESFIEEMEEKDYSKLFQEAYDYNNSLQDLKDPYIQAPTKLKNYNDIMNINGNGMIGYISIDKIKVELPIYHGTSESVLSTGVGHLEGSSLPVGGEGTHAVLSAHRGLPSSKLFTDLDKLEIGDIFSVTILNQMFTYKVEYIEIVEPHDIENLKINPKEDYLTLMTCTPYGINTHRLLVRGKRIENIEKPTYITTEAFKVSKLTVTPLVAVPIIFTLLLYIVFKPVKAFNNKIKEKYIYPTKSKNESGGKKNDKEKK